MGRHLFVTLNNTVLKAVETAIFLVFVLVFGFMMVAGVGMMVALFAVLFCVNPAFALLLLYIWWPTGN